MATTEAIFAMFGKVLGVIGMVLCMFICYFAWKVPDVARIVNENTFSSGRKRIAKFDPGFILVLTTMHFLGNSSNEKDAYVEAPDEEDDDSLVDIELASEHTKSVNKQESFYERGVPTARIRVPLPGMRLEDSTELRVVSGDCAICLNSYQPEDQVTWSSNQACPHVFHKECMHKWTEKVSSTHEDDGHVGSTVSCPCCRQVFIDCTTEECATEEPQVDQESPSQPEDEEQIAPENQV